MTAINSDRSFYMVIQDTAYGPLSGETLVADMTFKQLIKDIDRGEINDADLMGRISQIKGVPALTKDLEVRIKTLTKEYQAAEDPEVKMAKAYQIHEEVAGIMPASVSAQMQSWTYLAQLLFPLTWIVNVGGNMDFKNIRNSK